ncbi:MAG: hypothetical protein H6577_20745 [Lewinellaceae bacterium]|nr:hypothetical protein [Lewinellaceae bacterium]
MISTKIYDEIVEFIAKANPEQVVNFFISPQSQERVELLISKKKEGNLSEEENNELEYFLVLEHIMRLAKARAMKHLSQAA